MSDWMRLSPIHRNRRRLKEAFSAFRHDGASRFGAALAYYISLSIAPFALLSIAIAAMIFGRPAAEGVIFRQIAATVGPTTESAIREMMKNAAAAHVGFLATSLSLLTLLFGLLGIYEQIEDALHIIWKMKRPSAPTLAGRLLVRARAIALVLGVGLLLFVMISADAAIAITGRYAASHLVGGEPLWHVVQLAVSAVVLTALFVTVFRYIPVTRLPWRDVLPAAAFTAVLFVIGKFGLGLYLGKAAVGSSYGAAGSFVVILIWAYWSAQIFFFGLEVTHVVSVNREE